jgi:hypothetical protein
MVEPRERLSASIYLQIDLEIARMGDLPSDTAPRFGMDLPPMPTRSPRVSSFVAEENALGLMIDPVIDEYLERASTREVGIEVLDRRTFSKLMRDDSTERDPWTLTQKQKDAFDIEFNNLACNLAFAWQYTDDKYKWNWIRSKSMVIAIVVTAATSVQLLEAQESFKEISKYAVDRGCNAQLEFKFLDATGTPVTMTTYCSPSRELQTVAVPDPPAPRSAAPAQAESRARTRSSNPNTQNHRSIPALRDKKRILTTPLQPSPACPPAPSSRRNSPNVSGQTRKR